MCDVPFTPSVLRCLGPRRSDRMATGPGKEGSVIGRQASIFLFLLAVLSRGLAAGAEEKPYDPSVGVYPSSKTYKRPWAWGLTALLARKTKISEAQKNQEGIYQTERTIFQDPDLGGEVWKLTHDNVNDKHWYQDMSPWNADGSKIMFQSDRCRSKCLLMDGDATNAREHTTELRLDSDRTGWSRVNPDIHYSLRRGVLYEHNVRTGKSRELARTGGKALYQDPGRGGRYVVCFGGASSLHDLKTGKTVKFDVLRNARDERLKGQPCRLDEAQLVLDAEHPVRYDEDGKMNSGWFCVGADGVTAIHAFWKKEEPYYIKFRRGRHPGHPSWSPEGEKMIYFDREKWRGIFLIAKDGSWNKRLINNGGNGHTSWLHWSPDFAFAETPGGAYFKGMLVKIYTNDRQRGTVHRVVMFNSERKSYYDSPRLASSPDGTKVFWTANAFGTRDVYFAVAKHPDPPTNLQIQGDELSWTPPRWHREIKGYLVYGGRESGGPYKLLTPEPVGGTEYQVPRGSGPCFAVSSLEHSGLESKAYSNEVHSGRVRTLRLYFQAESGNPEVPMRLDSDFSAAGDLCVWASPGPSASFSIPVAMPLGGDFILWARTRGEKGETFPIETVGSAPASTAEWAWVRAGRLSLRRGENQVRISCAKGGSARIDAICLTNDPRFEPSGLCNLDKIPPGKVAGLRATPEGSIVKLKWDASGDQNLSHYDIHIGGAADFAPSNATLLFSPGENHFDDWGVPEGTRYYKIVAVDRAGNRSAPSEPAKVVVH